MHTVSHRYASILDALPLKFIFDPTQLLLGLDCCLPSQTYNLLTQAHNSAAECLDYWLDVQL